MVLIVPLFLFFVTIASTLLMMHCKLCSILVTVPHFLNVSFKKSYARHISATLLLLIGSTKIAFVSSAYIIDMYCIPLLLVNGESPFKSVYIFPLSGFDSPIAENTQILFSSLLGRGLFLSPVLIAHFLLIWVFSCLIKMSQNSCF